MVQVDFMRHFKRSTARDFRLSVDAIAVDADAGGRKVAPPRAQSVQHARDLLGARGACGLRAPRRGVSVGNVTAGPRQKVKGKRDGDGDENLSSAQPSAKK